MAVTPGATPAPLAHTPAPPYVAVVFTSLRPESNSHAHDDDDGYAAAADLMSALAAASDGYLGVESARGADGLGITVSYWRDEAAVLAWKRHEAHRGAQAQGRARWYAHYAVRVATVTRAYTFARG